MYEPRTSIDIICYMVYDIESYLAHLELVDFLPLLPSVKSIVHDFPKC